LTTVLVVDDQQSICNLVASAMKAEGFSVVTASSGSEALHVAHACAGHLDLLLTDFDMPGIDGVALAQEIRIDSPGLPVILMSGSYDPAVSRISTPWRFLPKPFSLIDLARTAHALVDESRPRTAQASN